MILFRVIDRNTLRISGKLLFEIRYYPISVPLPRRILFVRSAYIYSRNYDEIGNERKLIYSCICDLFYKYISDPIACRVTDGVS